MKKKRPRSASFSGSESDSGSSLESDGETAPTGEQLEQCITTQAHCGILKMKMVCG